MFLHPHCLATMVFDNSMQIKHTLNKKNLSQLISE